jgi:hypothetical protein
MHNTELEGPATPRTEEYDHERSHYLLLKKHFCHPFPVSPLFFPFPQNNPLYMRWLISLHAYLSMSSTSGVTGRSNGPKGGGSLTISVVISSNTNLSF